MVWERPKKIIWDAYNLWMWWQLSKVPRMQEYQSIRVGPHSNISQEYSWKRCVLLPETSQNNEHSYHHIWLNGTQIFSLS